MLSGSMIVQKLNNFVQLVQMWICVKHNSVHADDRSLERILQQVQITGRHKWIPRLNAHWKLNVVNIRYIIAIMLVQIFI